ncbi:MAG TPA: LacI family DNA-binding transcriptional regulator [Ktedonobacteraceae bacterium]|nr:LacI family DNA-binding transcriptional regulator [Ktedonobacteraceae bacterium]
MVTSEQVAQLAGVSRATVSRVLNGSSRISPEAKERVHAAIAALGYEPDVVAQSLVRHRSRMLVLGLWSEDGEGELNLSSLSKTSRYFYLDVLKSIENEAASQGYDLLLPSRPQGKTPENYIRSLQMRRVAGTIMVSLRLQPPDPRIHALLQGNIPTVFIDAAGHGSHATYVKADHIDSARQVTEHLLSLGHRRIVFLIGSLSDLPGMERLLGGQQALANAGIPFDPSLTRQGGWNVDEAYKTASMLLDERRDFTAIVAGSDVMAMGALRAIHEHGLRVPEDVSLTGFDDIELGHYTVPALTTSRQDHDMIGRGAVQRLIAIIEGKAENPPSPLIVPTQLVVRQSTGPAPSSL